MQRLNRPTHTPAGTAFFLFVSLAIIPVSLKAAGLQVGLSPRLSAAIDIWRQVAQAFGPNYETGSGSELAALISSEGAPSKPADVEACPLQQYACDREVEASFQTSPEIPAAFVQTPEAHRPVCSKSATRNQLKPRQLEAGVVPVELGPNIEPNIEESARALRALSAKRAEVAMRMEVLKILEKCATSRSFELNDSIKNLPIPKSFRMLVRFKQPAVPSVTGAACKVRTALAPAGRLRLERASLNTTPAAPDDCDL